MDDIHSILQRSLKAKGLKPTTDAVSYLHSINNWLQAQSTTIAEGCKAVQCTSTEVCIETTHAIAAQEMQSVIPDLKHFLAEECKLNIESVYLKRK